LFTAATLYFLIRGLKNNRRNDLLIAGICLGLGMYGYSADRILPLLALAVITTYLFHRDSIPYRKETILAVAGMVLVAVILFVPMLRYAVDFPDAFLARSLTRLSSLERPLPGSVVMIFLNNLLRALSMVSWSNGEIWTLSVPYRPALEVVTGALFWLGTCLAVIRIALKRSWIDISLLLSIPILMLPSILSLAFPAENPNLYRTGGAIIPVFLLIAMALVSLMGSLENRPGGTPGKIAAWGLATLVFLFSSLQSYDLVFNQYDKLYRLSSWNSSEMGQVIRNFAETTSSPDTAWLIGYPYWVDSRLVGMMSGQITRDVALPIERLPETVSDPRPKLFILHPQDSASVAALQERYPQGNLSTYTSKTPTKDFLIFTVPATP
jgi:hypothetical protein